MKGKKRRKVEGKEREGRRKEGKRGKGKKPRRQYAPAGGIVLSNLDFPHLVNVVPKRRGCELEGQNLVEVRQRIQSPGDGWEAWPVPGSKKMMALRQAYSLSSICSSWNGSTSSSRMRTDTRLISASSGQCRGTM